MRTVGIAVQSHTVFVSRLLEFFFGDLFDESGRGAIGDIGPTGLRRELVELVVDLVDLRLWIGLSVSWASLIGHPSTPHLFEDVIPLTIAVFMDSARGASQVGVEPNAESTLSPRSSSGIRRRRDVSRRDCDRASLLRAQLWLAAVPRSCLRGSRLSVLGRCWRS